MFSLVLSLKIHRVCIAASVFCTMVACNSGSSSSDQNLSSHGVIFSASGDRSALRSLYRADFESKEPQEIFTPEEHGVLVNFGVSSDGKYVAALAEGPDFQYRNLWIFPLTSPDSSSEAIIKLETIYDYSWSAVGSELLFTSSEKELNAEKRLYRYSPSRDDQRQLTFSQSASRIAWSPNGNHASFISISNGDPTTQILMTVNVSNLNSYPISTPLTSSSRIYYLDNSWAPDGEYIFYSFLDFDGSNTNQLKVARFDGTQHRILSDDFIGVNWSRDGSRISFVEPPLTSSSSAQIRIVQPDGENLTDISGMVPNIEAIIGLLWMDDSRYFFKSAETDSALNFSEQRFVYDAAKLELHNIDTPLEQITCDIQSSPNHERFALSMAPSTGNPFPALEVRDSDLNLLNTLYLDTGTFCPYGDWSAENNFFYYRYADTSQFISAVKIIDSAGGDLIELPSDDITGSDVFQIEEFSWSKIDNLALFKADTPLLSSTPHLFILDVGNKSAVDISRSLSVGEVQAY